MALSVAQEAALKSISPLVFVAVEIVAPTFTIRLLDGSSEVTIDGNTFTGGDPTYGAINAIENLGDGVADEAPSCRIILNPPTNVASANLSAPDTQGSPVSIWLGSLNPVNGAYIDRYLWFAGELDQGVLIVGNTQRTLTISCTAMDLFFEQDTGIRLNNSWHQSVWPGELGLIFVNSLNRQVPWGVEGNAQVTPGQTIQNTITNLLSVRTAA
jgi:hypothetical protein